MCGRLLLLCGSSTTILAPRFRRTALIGVGRLANDQNKRRRGETAFTGFGTKRS